MDSLGWKESVREAAAGQDGNAGLGVVTDLLCIFHPFSEESIPGTRVVLEVGLIKIKNVLRRNPFGSFFAMVEELVDVLMGLSHPAVLDEFGLPHREILVASYESMDKVHTKPLVADHCIIRMSQKIVC